VQLALFALGLIIQVRIILQFYYIFNYTIVDSYSLQHNLSKANAKLIKKKKLLTGLVQLALFALGLIIQVRIIPQFNYILIIYYRL